MHLYVIISSLKPSFMKLFYILFFASFTYLSSNGQFTVNSNYTLGLPQQSMKNNINAIHQFRVQGLYALPDGLRNLSLGLDIGFGTYANLRMPTTFSFGNGNPTSTYVNYSSNTALLNAVVQYDLVRKKSVIPYVTLKGGVQRLGSRIFVEDPNDIDGCRPLESKNILKDNTAILSYGGGLKIDFSSLFSFREKGRHFIDLGVVQTRGGEIEYINTKKLKSHDHNAVTPNPLGDGAKPLNMRFINVQSNVTHDHMVAEVYTTPLRVLEIKLGYTYRF
jgi:hypothetical protein